jgi:AcrR family transcriptional regulator
VSVSRSSREPRAAGSPRPRLSADDRRRQLIGIGLSRLIEKPLHELSIDEVAAQAGISRGLLFHYFATKSEFYLAVVEAAGQRVLRNSAPDPSQSAQEQLHTMVRGFVEQIERRRTSYISFVRGAGGGHVQVVEVYDRIREVMTQRVMDALSSDGVAPALSTGDVARDVVHAWWAYVEDRAIEWAGRPKSRRAPALDGLVAHCVASLHALLATAEAPHRNACPSPR